jgi:hypothetical protein
MVAGACAAGTLALAAPAMAAGPHASVKPNINLKNGQVVKVTFGGYKAGGTVYGLQCSKHVKVAADAAFCDTKVSDVKVAKANAKGGGSFSFTVHTGKIGKGQCMPISTNCVIAVAAQTTPPMISNASIHFHK